MKFAKPIIIILISVAMLLFVVFSYLSLNEEVVEVDWFSVDSGNTPGNIVNGGRVARQGDWVFKAYYRDRAGIYKVNIDGSGLKRLNTDHASNINVIGDWIYYTNNDDGSSIYKIRTDGSGRTKLHEIGANYLYVVDDWIFYYFIDLDIIINRDDDVDILDAADKALQSRRVCRIRTDGSDYSNIFDGTVFDFTIFRSWIYYSNWDDSGKLYRTNFYGNDNYKISENTAVSSLQVYGDWIYYTSDGPRYREEGIYRSLTNGTKDELIVEGSIVNINVFDGWIYYIDKNKGSNLYKIRTNGWGKKRINDTITHSVSLDGNWVYFTGRSGFYKIRPDGTGMVLLQEF